MGSPRGGEYVGEAADSSTGAEDTFERGENGTGEWEVEEEGGREKRLGGGDGEYRGVGVGGESARGPDAL